MFIILYFFNFALTTAVFVWFRFKFLKFVIVIHIGLFGLFWLWLASLVWVFIIAMVEIIHLFHFFIHVIFTGPRSFINFPSRLVYIPNRLRGWMINSKFLCCLPNATDLISELNKLMPALITDIIIELCFAISSLDLSLFLSFCRFHGWLILFLFFKHVCGVSLQFFI